MTYTEGKNMENFEYVVTSCGQFLGLDGSLYEEYPEAEIFENETDARKAGQAAVNHGVCESFEIQENYGY